MNEEALLHTLGISEFKTQGEEYLCDCIFCGDIKGNLQINFKKKVYHCWACDNKGSLTKMISDIRGVSRKEANELFTLDIIDVDYELDYIDKFFADVIRQKYLYKHYMNFNADRLWYKERGINVRSVNKYGLGFDDYTNRLVIPIRDEEGICVGLTRRGIFNSQNPKYLHTTGLPKSGLLYGWNEIDHEEKFITIVEGNIDCIKLNQISDMNAVALMGTSISMIQVEMITENFNSVMLMLDHDEAGEKGINELTRRFEHKMEVFRVQYNTQDPGDMKNKNQIIGVIPYTLA